MWESFVAWFWSLGQQYGVNPLVFGLIYVGAIPFFTLSIGWLIRNLRHEKSIVLPALLAAFFFVSAYLYLAVAGRNIPVWVYLFLAAMVSYGAYSTFVSVRTKVNQSAP